MIFRMIIPVGLDVYSLDLFYFIRVLSIHDPVRCLDCFHTVFAINVNSLIPTSAGTTLENVCPSYSFTKYCF